jgi:hypothetical protein
MSILLEYVASIAQSMAVAAEEVEFGHMPPNTYSEVSAEERV